MLCKILSKPFIYGSEASTLLRNSKTEFLLNFEIYILIVLHNCRSFTANVGTTVAVLSRGRSSTANSGTKVAVLVGIEYVG